MKDNTQLRNMNCKGRWSPQKQQNSVDCSKDIITEICNTIFRTLKSNKVEENKNVLNKAMDCQRDRNRVTRVQEESTVQAVIHKKKPFQ